MGILDEAIREHLELKRQHGAEGDELKRLEDEAFGPPARPGEPDFPGAETETEVGAGAAEAPTTVVGAEAPADGAEEPTGEEQLAAPEPLPEPPAAAAEPPSEAVAEPEQEAAEHEIVGDASDAETGFYDQSLADELDLGDVDLGVEEGEPPDAGAPPPAEPPAPPIESLETVEHPLEPISDEHAVEPASDEHAVEPASDEHDLAEPAHPGTEPAEGDEPAEGEESPEGDEPESSEEDVLADTPEFLRDAPEDDELWFEQGEPKDFDFD
jgi:hypothetical protein